MISTILPVSGQSLRFRPITGADEILLWEAGFPTDGFADAGAELSLAETLAARTTESVSGDALDIAALPITDLDALLLLFRRSLFGEVIRAEVNCPETECGAKMDISFGVSEYLESQAPE